MRQKLLDSLDDDLRYAIEVENKQRVEDIENYDEVCALSCCAARSKAHAQDKVCFLNFLLLSLPQQSLTITQCKL